MNKIIVSGVILAFSIIVKNLSRCKSENDHPANIFVNIKPDNKTIIMLRSCHTVATKVFDIISDEVLTGSVCVRYDSVVIQLL